MDYYSTVAQGSRGFPIFFSFSGFQGGGCAAEMEKGATRQRGDVMKVKCWKRQAGLGRCTE